MTPKEKAKEIYRRGYYDSNIKARMYKDTLIIENIIDKDFEKVWEEETKLKYKL